MGRLGITYEQVAETAELLLANGENITIEKIRRKLGDTGSNSNIGRHLREWKEEQLKKSVKVIKHENGLSDPLQKMMAEMLEKLRGESQAEVERIQLEAKEAIAQAQEEKTKALQIIQVLEEKLGKAELQVNHLQADLKLKTEEWKQEREQRIDFEARLRESEKSLKLLQDESNKRVSEVEHTYKEMIDNLKIQYEANEKNYKKEIDEYKTLLESQRQKYMVELENLKVAKEKVEKVNIKLETDLQHQVSRYKELEEYKRGLEADLSVVSERLLETERQLIKLKAESDHKDNKINFYREILDGLKEKQEVREAKAKEVE